jgi:hypothetical protein
MTKNIIWVGIISYNSSKFLNDIIILKDKEKDNELVFSAVAKYFLESKKSFLLFLVVRGKIGIDCEEKLLI